MELRTFSNSTLVLLSSVTKVEICVIVKRKEDGGGLLRPRGGGGGGGVNTLLLRKVGWSMQCKIVCLTEYQV